MTWMGGSQRGRESWRWPRENDTAADVTVEDCHLQTDSHKDPKTFYCLDLIPLNLAIFLFCTRIITNNSMLENSEKHPPNFL